MDSTLIKGLKVLEALVRANAPRSAAELVGEVGLVRSNVHRTLETLVHAGYVSKEPGSSRYRPTLRVLELGAIVMQGIDVRLIARPFLERLAAVANETVLLAIPDGNELVYLDKIEPHRPIVPLTRIGSRVPAHCTAPGKAILAFATDQELARLPLSLPRFTSATICSRAALLKDLATARRHGYAVNRGEWRDGVNGVAAPIFGHEGQVLGALSISGPDSRFGLKVIQRVASELLEATRAISAQVGGNTSR